MTDAARPALQRRFPSPPAARRSRNAMSSRPAQTLSSPRAHPRRPHPSPTKTPSCRLPTITPAAFRPRRHIGDPSAILKSP
jgi:hypothetical protein